MLFNITDNQPTYHYNADVTNLETDNKGINLYNAKKKKKKKKNRTSVWVKMPKVMPQIPHYLSFLLGKGWNPYA